MSINNNPFINGRKLKLGLDLTSKGFNRSQMVDVFYSLIAEKRQNQLLMECASFEEIDEHYNPGEEADRLETEESPAIFEAVRVKTFARTAQTMAALQRVLNKYLSQGEKGLSVGEAVIGKPKKSGLFASVTVQFPVSDGQTISIIFHSPDGNKMKITADDEILAFRWLLNKRDITVAVSPEGEGDVSLEEVGRRTSQLVEKNTERFQTTQKALVEAKQALDDIKAQVDTATADNQKALDDLKAAQVRATQLDNQLGLSKDKLEKVKDYNDKLQSQLDALVAANAGNAGKAEGTNGGGKAEDESAAFEVKKQAFEGELKGRGFSVTANNNYELVNNDSSIGCYIIKKLDGSIELGCNAKTDKGYKQNFNTKTLTGLDTQIQKALAWIDKKLAGMKKDAKPTYIQQAINDPIAHEAWTLPTEEVKSLSTADYEAIYGELKDGNYHSENVIFMAKRSGTDQDVEDANTIREMKLKAGELTPGLNAWRNALENWIKGTGDQTTLDKAKEAVLNPPAPEPGKVNSETAGEPDQTAASVVILDDILNGKYQSSDEVMPLLEQVATDLEALALPEDDPAMVKLGLAADYMTTLLDKENA